MIRTKKPAEKPIRTNILDKSINISNVEVKARFIRVESICLETWAMYLGGVKACIYSKKDGRFHVQNYLPQLPILSGPFRTEKEAKDNCIKIARTFCALLDHE